MSTAALPTKPAEKDDLLVPFEQQVLPQEYQQYYRTKRNNFFASIQKFPELWGLLHDAGPDLVPGD